MTGILETSALSIGILLGAYHHVDRSNPYEFTDPQGRTVHNGATPGIYLSSRKTCLTAGAYYNSWRRQSIFLGCTASFTPSPSIPIHFSLTGGLISGYANSNLLLLPSIRIGDSASSLRLFVFPGNLPGVAAAIEFSLP